MFLFRKIGSVLRGKATPRQVLFATVLGGLLGFVPGFFLPGDLGGGFRQAPGLILSLLCCALVLNANLAVFSLTTLVAKIVSIPLLSVSYSIGTFLIDAMPGVFRGLVNGKVTAWFGFENYATTGGLVSGLLFGVVTGMLFNRAVRTIRQRMADAEQNSERYQKFAQKRWVKVGTWMLLGKGKGKQSWQELAESQKRGLPIRLTGVLLVGVLVTSLWVFQQWFSTPILTHNLRTGLETLNGATVDVHAATIDLGGGLLRVQRLAMADSKSLDKDLLAADELTAKIDVGELLRRRFVIDELTSDSARAGSPRTTPGVVLPSAKAPPPEPAPSAGEKTIEDYLRDFEVWKQRFEQAREWFSVVAGQQQPAAQRSPDFDAQQRAEQEKTVGLAKVVATQLLEDSPRVLIRKIQIRGIDYSYNGQREKVDLVGNNLSTNASLVAETPMLGFAAQSEKFRFQLAGTSKDSAAMGFQFALKNVPVDSLFGRLKLQGAAPVRGGLMDIDSKGTFTSLLGKAMTMDLPLQVAMRDTTFALPGATETKVEKLLLPIGLRGSLTRPSVSLDDKVLQDALVAAGKQELANFVQGQAGKLLGGLPTNLQGIVDPSKSPGQIVDGVKAKAEAEAKRLRDEAQKKLEEEAKKRLQGGLQGLLPGGRKN